MGKKGKKIMYESSLRLLDHYSFGLFYLSVCLKLQC